MNETLAKPYDLGASPITKEQLHACCGERGWEEAPTNKDGDRATFLGLDYGPINSDKSYTTLSIVRKISGRYEVLYGKRFVGKEAEYTVIHDEVTRLVKLWNCVNVCSDYGMGEASNSVLRKMLGVEKIISFQHMANQKEMVK
tara:strand:- start:237 stop:665 length:429 start_codon:yes stop_codon:yes gene_type:complete